MTSPRRRSASPKVWGTRRSSRSPSTRVVAATAFPGREGERAEVAERLVELGREHGLSGFELAGHQMACRLRLQLFEVRAADAHARTARRMAEQLRLPLPAMQQRLWDCSRRALDGEVSRRPTDGGRGGAARLALVGARRDARHRSAYVAAARRCFRRGSPAARPRGNGQPADGCGRKVAGVLSHGRRDALVSRCSTPRDWAWLVERLHPCTGCPGGWLTKMRSASAYEMLRPARG